MPGDDKLDIIFRMLDDMRGDIAKIDGKIDEKMGTLAEARRKEAYERGNVNGRIEAVEKQNIALQQKHDKLVWWLLGLSAYGLVQLALNLATRGGK